MGRNKDLSQDEKKNENESSDKRNSGHDKSESIDCDAGRQNSNGKYRMKKTRAGRLRSPPHLCIFKLDNMRFSRNCRRTVCQKWGLNLCQTLS